MTDLGSPTDTDLLKSLTVLYAEDNEEIRDQLCIFLRRRVGTLLTADNGESGLALYRQAKPDMIITDILMPKMDGLSMARAIRNDDTQTPIIVTTAYNDENFFMRAIELSIDQYVLKPTDPYQLINAVLRCGRNLWRQREREAANQYARFLLDIQTNPLAVINEGAIEHLNKAFIQFLGVEDLAAFREQQKSGLDILLILGERSYSLTKESAQISNALLEAGDAQAIVYLRCAGGGCQALKKQDDLQRSVELRPFAASVNLLEGHNKLVFTFADIASIESHMRKLEEIAFTDGLTGVANRASLQQILNAEMQRSRRHGGTFSIILFDIDHFKQVNDNFGHQVGDDVLRLLASTIADNLRATDTIARWGGEEFMVVCPEINIEAAHRLAEKLRQLIEHITFPEVKQITSSFGVTQFQKNDQSRSLTQRADCALYRAKEGGRNRVEQEAPAPDENNDTPTNTALGDHSRADLHPPSLRT
ncbi:response regulator receiver modulated diguanylate cyclase [Magnetococcus marinus MC-1]|uniref:diguanylate cyclase n=1 Tax=Magnetococcus marinus (strain ATCC BAA-1437 / JCM 17883 / MC-1) TaxID=156889 RepID=A0L7G7_MAGMM|nr:diguanylate cyclase [Magnetococcus marinus]ABK43910.1 response regulator receiver modulated diguanylate cyclase [Magnetococcus marinus MC-1]